jgi:hypothetical protein
MIIYNVDLNKWCKKYEIEPFIAICPDCGADVPVKYPFMEAERVGLISLPCECGCENEPQIFVYRDPDHPFNNLPPWHPPQPKFKLVFSGGESA